MHPLCSPLFEEMSDLNLMGRQNPVSLHRFHQSHVSRSVLSSKGGSIKVLKEYSRKVLETMDVVGD